MSDKTKSKKMVTLLKESIWYVMLCYPMYYIKHIPSHHTTTAAATATIIIIGTFFTRVVVTIIAVNSFLLLYFTDIKDTPPMSVCRYDIAFEENDGVWFVVFVIAQKEK